MGPRVGDVSSPKFRAEFQTPSPLKAGDAAARRARARSRVRSQMAMVKCAFCSCKIQSTLSLAHLYGSHRKQWAERGARIEKARIEKARIDLTLDDSDAETEPWPGLVGEPRIIPANQAGGAQEHYEAEQQRAHSPPPPSSSSPPAAQPEERPVIDDDATSGGYEQHFVDSRKYEDVLPEGLRKAMRVYAPRRALAVAAARHAAPAAPIKYAPRLRKTIYHAFPRRSLRKGSHVLSVARPPGGHHRW